MKNILSYQEYQNRIKNITSPEEAAALTQELLAPAIAELSRPAPGDQHEDEVPDKPHAAVRTPHVSNARKPWTAQNPWSDVIGNETEAMVMSLYAKGMTTRDIVSYMKSIHGIELSQSSVSAITDKIFPLVKEWQARPLASCYPILYLDGLHFKVRDTGKIVPKFAYIAMGINQYGQKEVLGIWISDSEGAKFWMGVLNDLKNRGVEDILIACIDGLKGFPEAIKAIYPNAEIQVCIVHQIRHTIMFLPFKDRDQFCDDLKSVYTAPSNEAGFQALKDLMIRWPQYQPYLKGWETRWNDLAPFFEYPEPIRRMMYTTNAIENLNRQFRKVTKTSGMFPHDDALLKLLWLAQADVVQKWTLPVRNWGEAIAQFSILFPDRVQF